MARTVFANTRNFSHKGSGDKSICAAPDVCKTPIGSATPPIPYPVISQAGDAEGYTSTVFIDGNPTAIASSKHKSCSGDEPGVAKGVGSGSVGKKTAFTSYSFDVKAEGEGVVRHMDTTTMNNANTIGMVFGAATSPLEEADDEVEEILPILRFNLAPVPELRNRGYLRDEPYTLYADGGEIAKGLSDEEGTVEWEHVEGTKQYKVELVTGQVFLLDALEKYADDEETQTAQRLANRGYRSFDYKGKAPTLHGANKEAFRRVQAERGV